jgi:curli biogenesis system outer membrane secretion channel CsgG
MRKLMMVAATAAIALVSVSPAAAAPDKSSGRKDQDRGMREMPHCAKPLGTIAMVEPENQWWRQYSLGSPEAIIKVFVQESNCFTLVNRGRSMQSRAMERALADNGELQAGSNMGKGQVRAADFLLEPNIVTTNDNSGGSNVGGAIGGVLSRFGGGGANVIGSLAGGINIKKGEANVTLSVVDSRTTEEHVVEGYYRKTDVGFSASTSASWWGGFAGAGGGGYQNTQIGQVIVLAYLDAYIKLVNELGGS